MTTYTSGTISRDAREQLLEIARSFDLDPNVMSAENITADGYEEFLYTASGVPALHPGTLTRVRIRHPWPLGAWDKVAPLLDEEEV